MESCIHWLFEDQVEKRPDQTALLFEGTQTTYAALNRRSNKIAHALLRAGLAPGDKVAALLQDGPDAVAALLGILKAGASVVYLDPSYPTQRLITILAASAPNILLARSACLKEHDELGKDTGVGFAALVLLDNLSDAGAGSALADVILGANVVESCPGDNPARTTKPEDAAYIVYTSGSTGEPKGIIQSHRSFCQYIEWQSRQFCIRAPERFAQWASFAYDACYREVFSTLCFGATLCLAPAAVRYNPRTLIDWLKADQVSIINVVPSFWRQVVEILQAEHKDKSVHPLPDLKVLLHPGEPIPVDLAETWLTAFPNPPRLFNLYGPSECILATYYEVKVIAPGQRSVPIGQAIDGREILILDENQKPCVPGVEGEIYVRSKYLTMGYYNRPEETAEKFIQNPAHTNFDDPVLRTGDLGRLREDGMIDFCGRRDRMVKIRGQRVEPGDIEYVLRRHDKICNCAVVVRTRQARRESMVALEHSARDSGSAGEQFLVAYFTATEAVSTPELRAYLEMHLPVHMVPQRFVQLDELPLNANRKLDVNALLDLDEVTRPEVKAAYLAPRTELEKQISDVWQSVLGIDKIGINDAFLELGGDSLLAMQVLNRMSKTVNLDMSFRELFEAQTVANLAALGRERQAAAPAKATQEPTASAVEDPDRHYPLSNAQEGLWILWQLDPDNPYYTGQGCIRIKGAFDLATLNKAWQALLDRHELMRVRFARQDSHPSQRFVPTPDVSFKVEDLTHLPKDQRNAAIEATMRERSKRAFNLETDSLLEYRLYKLGEDEHVIAISFHEIILDLWGLTVLIRDLAALYKNFADGAKAAPPSLGFRYRDYVQREHDTVTREKMVVQSDYWREQLSGELPMLSLPTDRPYPTKPSYRGDARSVFLDADLSAQLKDLARIHGATLFVTLLSGISLLLRMYSGQDDIIVGSPLANRQHPESEDLAGFFLNMLPLRTRFSDDPSFTDVLNGMRETVTGALSHADYPFAWMLEGAMVTRDLSAQPVFQVMFNMLNLPHISQESGGIKLTYDEFNTGYVKYDLNFYAQEQGDRIYFRIAYLTDLFDGETVQRMLDNFVVLLSSLVAAPETAVSKLRKLDESEQRTLLLDYNETSRPYPMDDTVHQLFERQAATTPDAPAYLFGSESLSYRELNERANRLARHLRQRGVTAETRAAICIDRSFDMAVGLMAILKAGGTSVALDTEAPPLQLKEILHESSAEFLLVSGARDPFDDYAGTKICLDTDRADIEAQSSDNLEAVRRADMTMNIVYTSSTTGRPKGVLIPESAVLNRLYWMWDDYPFKQGDVALLQKSYAIVASSWELFGALLKGYPTVILTYEELIDPARLLQRVVEHNVSHLLATPALIEGILLLGPERAAQWHSLRFATTSAEQIPVSMVEDWRATFPGVPLLNLYGATECSSNVTVYDTKDVTASTIRVPLGKPLSNVQTYVLDSHGDPVPLGATGELCVAGICVASGYLNNDDLNESKFLNNRFSDKHGPIIYRTGDRARYRANGNLELLGRSDDQVTIRGFRVEMNDVESMLMHHDRVEKAVVVMANGAGSRKRLVAFVSLDREAAVNDLRSYLVDRLPRYMVPADFIALDHIPLTQRGKVDRGALTAMAACTAPTGESYVAPRTPMEQALTEIWTEVLGIDKIGTHDDFFDLGGHSLMAIRVVSRIHQALGLELSVQILFNHPTIHALAEQIFEREIALLGENELADMLLELEEAPLPESVR